MVILHGYYQYAAYAHVKEEIRFHAYFSSPLHVSGCYEKPFITITIKSQNENEIQSPYHDFNGQAVNDFNQQRLLLFSGEEVNVDDDSSWEHFYEVEICDDYCDFHQKPCLDDVLKLTNLYFSFNPMHLQLFKKNIWTLGLNPYVVQVEWKDLPFVCFQFRFQHEDKLLLIIQDI